MIKLIQWLIFGHAHKYEQVETAELKRLDNGSVIGKIYIMRCNNCGQMKKFEVLT